MTSGKTVFVVDDDDQMRSSLCALATSMDSPSRAFATAEEFLAAVSPRSRGVVVTDLRMPGMDGLELQKELARRHSHLPVIILTAYARTPITVEAMRAGAVTMIDKPYHDDDLAAAIRWAMETEETRWQASGRRRDFCLYLASLTPGERQVMDRILRGKLNKIIARDLAVSIRTVEKRRHEIMSKMKVTSVAELAALVSEFGRDEGNL